MRDMLLTGAAVACAYAAFVALALSQKAHWVAVSGERQAQALPRLESSRWRWRGSLGLVASVLLSLWAEGPSFGSLLAVLYLSAAAAAVAFTLSWRPSWLRILTLQRRKRAQASGRGSARPTI